MYNLYRQQQRSIQDDTIISATVLKSWMISARHVDSRRPRSSGDGDIFVGMRMREIKLNKSGFRTSPLAPLLRGEGNEMRIVVLSLRPLRLKKYKLRTRYRN
jgi:hypothetical protein